MVSPNSEISWCPESEIFTRNEKTVGPIPFTLSPEPVEGSKGQGDLRIRVELRLEDEIVTIVTSDPMKMALDNRWRVGAQAKRPRRPGSSTGVQTSFEQSRRVRPREGHHLRPADMDGGPVMAAGRAGETL